MFAAAHPHRSCPGVSPRRIASSVRSRRSKFHIIRFRTRAKAHSFHCCSSSHKIFDFAGALNYREVVASLAGSISFGGGDSIFKVHRETVPSIGSQRERHFIDPSLTNWENFSDLNEKTFENFSVSLPTNQLGNFLRFWQSNLRNSINFSKGPFTYSE